MRSPEPLGVKGAAPLALSCALLGGGCAGTTARDDAPSHDGSGATIIGGAATGGNEHTDSVGGGGSSLPGDPTTNQAGSPRTVGPSRGGASGAAGSSAAGTAISLGGMPTHQAGSPGSGGPSPGGASPAAGATAAGVSGSPGEDEPVECDYGVPCGDCGTACRYDQVCVAGNCRCPEGTTDIHVDLPGGDRMCTNSTCPSGCGADADCRSFGCIHDFSDRFVFTEERALLFQAGCLLEEDHPNAGLYTHPAATRSIDLATGEVTTYELAWPCDGLYAVTGYVETPAGPYFACASCKDSNYLHFPDGTVESSTNRPLTLIPAGDDELLFAFEDAPTRPWPPIQFLSTSTGSREWLDCPCERGNPVTVDADAVYCVGTGILRCERTGAAVIELLADHRPTQLFLLDGYLYFDTLSYLRRMPVTGGDSEVVAEYEPHLTLSPSGWVLTAPSRAPASMVYAQRVGSTSDPVELFDAYPHLISAVGANESTVVIADSDGNLVAVPLPED